ncbi:hypothetical protein D046_5414 [Vibrio parahaemolyticus V-223/04]|nr:hypothetical protein D046_5414 [Vibrio parahaemolyticus V-223/04]
MIKFNLVKVKAQQKGKRLTAVVIESPRKFLFLIAYLETS